MSRVFNARMATRDKGFPSKSKLRQRVSNCTVGMMCDDLSWHLLGFLSLLRLPSSAISFLSPDECEERSVSFEAH
jgi:hypothetical protein